MASKPKTRKLEEVSVDEFFMGVDSLDENDSEVSEERSAKIIEKANVKKSSNRLSSNNRQQSKIKDVKRKSPSSSKQKIVNESLEHKKSLLSLKEVDPNFYKYLEENDKELLNFDMSESDDEDDNDIQGLHQPPQKLEVASDDSEGEDDNNEETVKIKKNKEGKIIVTISMINRWTDALQSEKPTLETLTDVVEAFGAAVEQAEDNQIESENRFKVNSSTIFNAVMRMCIVNLPPALTCVLKLPKKRDDENVSVSSSKCWPKIQFFIKGYLSNLLKILLVMAEPSIVAVLLKHTYQMVPYITATNRFSKGFLKKLIQFWSTSEETVRILSFMIIIRICRVLLNPFHEIALKGMYMAFVKNSKFTSPSTWPAINFMKHSLVEMFALDATKAYQYAFVYIRQLSIHLRNAITVKKKDAIAAVYNWQYIHCLNFWAEVLSSLHHIKILHPLIYPLVHIIIGTIRVIPIAKYYPLRFHCITALTLLAKDTRTFIPILPLITEVFEVTDFNKKHTKQSWKPLDFNCMLKLSKDQLKEHSFKDAALDQVYDHMLTYLNAMANKIGFPELVLPTIVKLKAFLKKCRVGNYSKQVKQLLDKIEENSKYILDQRKTANMHLNDSRAINAWENQQKLQETPIAKYYATYRKLRERELLHRITKKDQLEANDEVDNVRRRELMEMHRAKPKEDVMKLFSDELDNTSDSDLFSIKRKSDELDVDNELTDLSSISGSSESEDDNNS